MLRSVFQEDRLALIVLDWMQRLLQGRPNPRRVKTGVSGRTLLSIWA